MRWFSLSVGFMLLTSALATSPAVADADGAVPGTGSDRAPVCEALKGIQNSYDMDADSGSPGGGGFACPFCRMASGFLGNLMGMYRGAYGNASKKSSASAKKDSNPVTSILGYPGLTPSAHGSLSPSLVRSALY
jgi:hypothetical protein